MREVIEIILVNGAVQKHVMVENYRSTFPDSSCSRWDMEISQISLQTKD